jgi:hypothetical protein
MNCEVCKAIEKLGLDESVHESWYCVDAEHNCRLTATMRRSRLVSTCRARWSRMKQVAFPGRIDLQREHQRVRLMLRLRHLLTH